MPCLHVIPSVCWLTEKQFKDMIVFGINIGYENLNTEQNSILGYKISTTYKK